MQSKSFSGKHYSQRSTGIDLKYSMDAFDYIIIGAGAGGLMLAEALGKDSFFKHKSILLLDKDSKSNNDRTWCFWEDGKGDFDSILHKTWNNIYFGGSIFDSRMNISPYSYKMIKGIDFYSSYKNKIATYPNITFKTDRVLNIEDLEQEVVVKTENTSYTAKKVFNSILDYKVLKTQTKYPLLQQHFIGWFVKTEKPVFDMDQATFMDFSIPQKGNTRFMYVLPFSETEALVEYTLFSENLLPEAEYEEAIASYLQEQLQCSAYTILEKEKGNIPMTCFDFNIFNSKNLLHIGMAGGWAKPSSGYTFRYAWKKTKLLVSFLKEDKPLHNFSKKDRFWFYDLLLLDILHKDNSKGELIFGHLFKNRSPQLIFKFLDEETNIWEELKIITACPILDFTKALLRRLF
ncbi:lycopene cyclase family protein [Sediminicola arcticus]|jgi:lycopene beta-cyclase|uniref:Lycopene cyclase family protein n=1 Tax=Sediminicola arcticus TaxID=1574308 RepID=A0ABV2STV8_9FLAO